jgi:hypothetical protein
MKRRDDGIRLVEDDEPPQVSTMPVVDNTRKILPQPWSVGPMSTPQN